MATRADNSIGNRGARALGDMVIAELLLVQATIESAFILRDGIGDLRRQLRGKESDGSEDLCDFLKRTGKQLVEPYTTRYKYFKEIVNDEPGA